MVSSCGLKQATCCSTFAASTANSCTSDWSARSKAHAVFDSSYILKALTRHIATLAKETNSCGFDWRLVTNAQAAFAMCCTANSQIRRCVTQAVTPNNYLSARPAFAKDHAVFA
eukprot:gnl/TRDRNA2_/TRDRNA2_49288_c0_seq2.p1 gnl/TRDRNA2_/TRDRNA2_49288_c0~~gnl/TRDRNA2_/TRDRNA2_49288_c0_seq2.p1  ORF type:complete len:114 (-),score=12.89 gnl/TRDRNA2_/TRDRNA2_49288_c0_seq2:16-357(-)